MKKITLDVDALEVESFAAEAGPGGKRGTVHGHITLRCPSPTSFYCTLGYNTCDQASCVDTCGYPYKPAC
jgi:hypothetical protein